MNVKALRKSALVVIMLLILGVLAYEVFTGSLTVSTTVVAVGALALMAWGIGRFPTSGRARSQTASKKLRRRTSPYRFLGTLR